MTEQSKILGNPEKKSSIDDLLERAGRDKVVKGVLEGKPKKLINFRFLPCKGAYWAIKGIEDYIGFAEETGLVNIGIGENGLPHTEDNALLAAAYSGFGMKELGEKLIAKIEKHVRRVVRYGKRFDLFNRDTYPKTGFDEKEISDDIDTCANIAMGVAYISAGKKERGIELISNTEKHGKFMRFGEDRMLFNEGNLESSYTDENALLAYAYSLTGKTKDALEILEGIEKDIGYVEETGLIKVNPTYDDKRTKCNALYALACFSLGHEERGRKLLKAINETMHSKIYDKNAVLIYSSYGESAPEDMETAPNAAMALAHMAEQFYNAGK